MTISNVKEDKPNTSITVSMLAFRGVVLAALIGGATGFIGSMMQGIYSVQVERTKLESSLILKAIENETEKERRVFLEFLINTNLIKNSKTREGLANYLAGNEANKIPQAMIRRGSLPTRYVGSPKVNSWLRNKVASLSGKNEENIDLDMRLKSGLQMRPRMFLNLTNDIKEEWPGLHISVTQLDNDITVGELSYIISLALD